MTADTIPNRLLERARSTPNDPAYYVWEDEMWKPTSWSTHAKQVSRAGRALIALGLEPGGTVCIVGSNRPEWAIASIAAMGVGGVPVGVHTTDQPVELRSMIRRAEPSTIFVEVGEPWSKLEATRGNVPSVEHVVAMGGAPPVGSDLGTSWEGFLAKGDGIEEQAYLDRVEALEPDAVATLVYTSGATGPPKAAMLSHRNLTWTADATAHAMAVDSADRFLSFLPLSHITEQMLALHVPITTGARVHFVHAVEEMVESMKEVQPTVFFAVPRLWERFYAGIASRVDESGLLGWARRVGARANSDAGRRKGFQYWLAKVLIFSRLKHAIGLGKTRFFVSGAGSIAPEVRDFLVSLDIVVLEAYGQAEGAGWTSFNPATSYRLGSVGRVLSGVEVQVADDDEILIKGPNVFLGYYDDPEATAAKLTDDWLHTGDLGALDDDGFLSITGRKEDRIVTADGKRISPEPFETALKRLDLIMEAVVLGDGREFLSALVTIDSEAGQVRALREKIQSHIDEINAELGHMGRIEKLVVSPRELSSEYGEHTPTANVRRAKVCENFAYDIAEAYGDPLPAQQDAGLGRPFVESDNIGMRFDTLEANSASMAAWTARANAPRPSVFARFPTNERATKALLAISCIETASDTGNLISTEIVDFGVFEDGGTWIGFIREPALPRALYNEALRSFPEHGGTLVEKHEPTIRAASRPTRGAQSASPAAQRVVFREEIDLSQRGGIGSKRIYSAPSERAAIEFLKTQTVTRPYFYIEVETPEGSVGKDKEGTYRG